MVAHNLIPEGVIIVFISSKGLVIVLDLETSFQVHNWLSVRGNESQDVLEILLVLELPVRRVGKSYLSCGNESQDEF